MSTRFKQLPIGLQKQVKLINTLKSIISIQKFEKFDAFFLKNHNSILDLVSYSSVLTSEIIRNSPLFIKLYRKLKYRVFLLLNYGAKQRTQDEEVAEAQLTTQQEDLVKYFRSIYVYIVDIRIAQGVFAFLPYITTFLKDYSTVSKLKKNVNTLPKLEEFVKFALFAFYQFYETNGFLTSHNFIPNFTSLLLPKHQKDTSLTPSDWFYVYSCRAWFLANVLDTLKALAMRQVPSFNLICDDLLSLHWGSSNGFLRRDVFAIIGFLNNVTKFKELL